MSTESNNSKPECVSRMQINDTKAGMENIDKEKINAIILKNSQKSKFYLKQKTRENEQRKKAEEKLNSFRNFTNQELIEAEKKVDNYLLEIEKHRDFSRVIVHIDMDAFYANVEIRDNPTLADKPMAVGSDSMLSTSNYLARKYGVRAAMPGFIARELCPDLIIVPCNFTKYRIESQKIMKIISEYDPNYAAMSLDEAYLDITEHLKKRVSFEELNREFPKYYLDKDSMNNLTHEKVIFNSDIEGCVEEIRHRIYLATNLTASAGIACNLRLAKLCSDINKPNGQFKLESNVDTIANFIENMPIRKINGIGPSTSLILNCYGIETCKHIYEKRSMLYLLETQNTFQFLMNVCRGLGSNVIVNEYDKKSLGHETTFSSKLSNNKQEILRILHELSDEVSKELIDENLEAQKVHIKIKTIDFQVYTRTKSLNSYTNETDKIYEATKFLITNEYQQKKGNLKLRLIGVRVSDLRNINTIEHESPPQKTAKLGTIEKFFKREDKAIKNDNLVEDFDTESNDNNDLIEDYRFMLCPHCDYTPIEGNKAFLIQHLDACSNFFNFVS